MDCEDCKNDFGANQAWLFHQQKIDALEAELSLLLAQFSKVDLDNIRLKKECNKYICEINNLKQDNEELKELVPYLKRVKV